jgi:hypothetical protein
VGLQMAWYFSVYKLLQIHFRIFLIQTLILD